MEPGDHERLSFKIEKIDKHKSASRTDSSRGEIDNDALFVPPEKYIEID